MDGWTTTKWLNMFIINEQANAFVPTRHHTIRKDVYQIVIAKSPTYALSFSISPN